MLRRIIKDPDFRTQFVADPVLAITTAGIPVTTADLAKLTALTPEQIEQLSQGIGALAGAASAGLQQAKTEGTNTLVYAIIVALILAEA